MAIVRFRRPAARQSLRGREQVRVPHYDPRTVSLFPQNGKGVPGPDGRVAARQGHDADGKHGPGVGEVAGHFDFLYLAGRFDLVLCQQSAEPLLERSSSPHGRVPRNEKDDVLRHQLENGVHVSRRRGAVPQRKNLSNCLLIPVHLLLLSNVVSPESWVS